MTAELTVLVPCYNEKATLRPSVERVLALASQVTLEIIIVNDASKDNSLEIAQELAAAHPQVVRVCTHDVNQGKGAALHTGIRHATGAYVCIHDADLEYDPNDMLNMLRLAQREKVDVVFGSRFMGEQHGAYYHIHALANRGLTLISNIFSGWWISDMETCYKLVPRTVLQALPLKEKRFGFEPEIVARLARYRWPDGRRLSYRDVPINYTGRKYKDGKKIGIKDGFRALYCLVRYNFF